ncbi:unnamed protein product (macronuclear) [Paramecium tetraurelia]|uniref:protein-disulfide reductase n=1 Tax=Paramecium tetraurelia TaxID=5888 RepID=A0CIW1_PARTE|nr:uncharacterized protein GSPATT00007863001 [Paramecium tetraurelia]CAK70728.1 unnamed protein product [Paramecium tetraurelia]|eukprot:XP_001438125.1 hypothetical protein (macronuclear) [Paramecium tetraurelia strain d4-2]
MDNNFFGDNFVNKNGPCKIKLSDMKVVVLYFCASWCPPCVNFTPTLVEFYNDVNLETKQLEIIWISYEESEGQFKKYLEEMPWPAIPYNDKRIQQLVDKYEIKGIPTVTVLRKNGDIAKKNGKQDILKEGEGAYNLWEQIVNSE